MPLKDASSSAFYWDSVAKRSRPYHIEKNVAIYKKSEHIRMIKKWAGSLKGKAVLKTDLYEEAFGNDSFFSWLKGQGAYVYGVDISKNIVSRANSDPGLNVVSDLRDCGFRSASFDVIISNSTLDNLKESDVPAALNELRRMLKDGGVLLLTLDNAQNPLYVLGYKIEKILKTNNYYQARCYSLDEALSLAKKSRFSVEDVDAIVHLPTPFNKVALCLSRANVVLLNRASRALIMVFSKLAKRRARSSTGWFIALKCRAS